MDKILASQDDLMYHGMWNKQTDVFFIDELIKQKQVGMWHASEMSSQAIQLAMEKLNKKFNINVTYTDAASRRVDFEDRYETFKRLLSMKDIEWDIPRNKVYGSAEVWIELLKANPYARRYIYKGEPLWQKLLELFGPQKGCFKPDENEIINISDGTYPEMELKDVRDMNLYRIPVDDDDDEVLSPIGKFRYKAVSPPKNAHPRSDSSAAGVPPVRNMGKKPSSPMRNFWPPRPNCTKGSSSKNQSFDSCASSSPIKKFYLSDADY